MAFQYFSHTLSCGLRIVHQHSDSKVAYCGVAVNAGSRDEDASNFGIAHFVEHTIFKGTRRRKSWHIINRMERIGGELNAYTSKEETIVYSIFPCNYYDRAIELMGDLMQNSIFPRNELEKEREVVLDEIDSYRDSPSDAVYDDFEDYIFEGNGLGHNILGNESTLEKTDSVDCMNFLKSLYVPENMVLFSFGNIDFDRLCRYAEKYFGAMNHSLIRNERITPAVLPAFNKRISIDSHQSHTIYGVPTFGMYDSRKYAMALLNNMLAGPGMNSLLNLALRERRGYVYTVESSSTLFSDSGLFTIYFGCDDCHVKSCLRLINKSIDDIALNSISAKALDFAKRQYTGQLLLSTENRENSAITLGKSMLFFNRVSSIDEMAERITSVTSQEIMDIAQIIASDKASILTLC
ncbi:MAG: pitrilysin family protein [Muribaculaceae bacterium]|nr:pitrilysin family protein [Muribaculaceae bacterium]